MRKMMTKEVQFTDIKASTIFVEDGKPVLKELEVESVMGNLNKDKAHKHMTEKYENLDNVTVYDVNNYSITYEMEVEEFIKYAKVKDSE